MPRNVRNFRLAVKCDARSRAVETGPVSEDGTFSCRILIRENGAISDRDVVIYGVCLPDGTLEVRADSDEPEHKASDRAIVLLRGRR
jgi:hypothetical protein